MFSNQRSPSSLHKKKGIGFGRKEKGEVEVEKLTSNIFLNTTQRNKVSPCHFHMHWAKVQFSLKCESYTF